MDCIDVTPRLLIDPQGRLLGSGSQPVQGVHPRPRRILRILPTGLPLLREPRLRPQALAVRASGSLRLAFALVWLEMSAGNCEMAASVRAMLA